MSQAVREKQVEEYCRVADDDPLYDEEQVAWDQNAAGEIRKEKRLPPNGRPGQEPRIPPPAAPAERIGGSIGNPRSK